MYTHCHYFVQFWTKTKKYHTNAEQIFTYPEKLRKKVTSEKQNNESLPQTLQIDFTDVPKNQH